MKSLHALIISCWLAVGVLPVCAQEKLDTMVAAGETYKNVTVTGVTATHVQFLHSRGSGSVKLKSLSPELQKRFGYDAGVSAAAEQGQRESDSRYRADASTKKPVTKRSPAADADKADDDADIVVPKLYAKSFRGKKGPMFQSEKWIGATPDTKGKFVLIDFWATWCGPCRASIPHLNQLQSKFKDRLVVIGLTDETVEQVKAMKSPKIEYAVAVDTQGRMSNEAQVRGIPHAMLLDPDGIVRFEGMPNYLTEKGLERLLDKYSK